MKRNYLLITALIAITVFGAGCSKEESSTIEDSNELKVTTNIIEPSTKSIITEFSSSTIGVYVDDILEKYYICEENDDDGTYNPTTNSIATVSTGDNFVTVNPSISITADATVYAWYPATADELENPTSFQQ